MPPTEVSRGRWSFRNVTRAYNFWPIIPTIEIVDAHPMDVATFAGRIEKDADTLFFKNEDEIWCKFDDGVDNVKMFAGYIKVATMADHGRSGPQAWEINASDYTSLLLEDLITSQATRRKEPIADRLAWIMSFHTKGITIVFSDLPDVQSDPMDYLGNSVGEALDQVLQEHALSAYVDFDKGLHIFRTETITAPFGIAMGTALPPDTYPAWDWTHESDSTELGNAALVIGDKKYEMVTEPGSISEWGRKEFLVNDGSLENLARMSKAADRALLNSDEPQITGKMTIARSGLRAGMTLEVSHYLWPQVEAGGPYIVSQVSTTAVDPHDPVDGNAQIRVDVEYTDRRRHKAPGRPGGGDTEASEGGPITVVQRELLNAGDDRDAGLAPIRTYSNPTNKHIGSAVWHNVPHPSTDCGTGFGGWSGFNMAEGWYEMVTGSIADNVLGLRMFIPPANPDYIFGVADSDMFLYGYAADVPSPIVQWGKYHIVGGVDWVHDGATVTLPRSAINEGGTTYFVLAPGWRCSNGFFCASELADGLHGPAGALTSGGEGWSGECRAPVITAKVLILSGGRGLTPWIPGTGQVDGYNRLFSLYAWDGKGVPKVKVNGLVLDRDDYDYDADLGTVHLHETPEMGDRVSFQYRAST